MPKAGDPNVVMERSVDELLEALDGLMAARKAIARRATKLKRQLAAGKPLVDIVATEEQPLIVQVLRESNANLVTAFSRFQRVEAQLLYREGMSMERIGRMFGLSRQRVADLVRS